MNLAILLRQDSIHPETATSRQQMVWFLVNHVELQTGQIEFSGPDEVGTIAFTEDNHGDVNFHTPESTRNKYPDTAPQYGYCFIKPAASALAWPAALRIDTPCMSDERDIAEPTPYPPLPEMPAPSFTDRTIDAAVLLSRNKEVTAFVNWTEPNHAGRMEIMAVRPPFHFVFDYEDEKDAERGGKWRTRVWLKPAEERADNPAISIGLIAPESASPEHLADAFRSFITGFRLDSGNLDWMDGCLYNGENNDTLEQASADGCTIQKLEDVHGQSAAYDCLINLQKAADIFNGGNVLRIRMECFWRNTVITLPDCDIADATKLFNSVFK